MEAILIITAVHINNPKDIPATLWMTFPSISECEKAKQSIEYNFKFKQFVVDAKCQKKS